MNWADAGAPAVEMLWEAHDPHRALAGRFGFGDGESAGRWVAATLNEHWGVRVHSCERIVISDRNALAWIATSSGRMLAKWSVMLERFPRLMEMARLTRWLDGQGLPVSAPVRSRAGRLQVEVDGVSMCLQREIEGDLLDTADADQVSAAGAVLARLQDALAAYPDADRVAVQAAPSASLTQRVTDWLDSDVEHVPATARDTLRRLIADAPPNILCAGFLAGYQSVRRLTPIEAGWWDVLVLWYALAMVPSGGDPTGWRPSALDHATELAARVTAVWS